VAAGRRRSIRSFLRDRSLQQEVLEGGAWVCSSAWSSGSDDDGGVVVLPERKRYAG
jgi:hypothetical protein